MRVRVTTLAVENSIIYSECVSVALIIQHVLSMRRYLNNGTIFVGWGVGVIEHNMCVFLHSVSLNHFFF